MTNNILNSLQERNKQLLNEIEFIKNKQVKNKEENFKLRIWNAIENVKQSQSSEIAGTLMTLEQHFLPKDEFALEDFIKGCAEWTWNSSSSFGYISDKNKELEKNNALLEKQVAELTPLKEQVEDLENEVEMEREESEKALNVAMKWRKNQMAEVVEKRDAREKQLLDQINFLEKRLLNEQQKANYYKELPALPKQQKQNRLWKLKQLVSKVKEKTREKFQTFIVQKSK